MEVTKMKTYFVSAALVFLIFCGSQTAWAHPGYGWHGDANGNGELVLDYPHAKDFVNALGRSENDPVTQQTVTELVTWAGRFSAAIPYVKATFTVVNGLMYVSKFQMQEATAAPNYEAYGFKMTKWFPYRCVTYSYDDYTLLREDGNPAVYAVVADAKFWVPNGSYFNYDWGRIKVVPRGRLGGWYPYPRSGALLREQSNPAVNLIGYGTINPQYTWVNYVNQQGFVRRVVSYNAFVRLGFSWGNVRVVPDGAFSSPNPYLPRGLDLL
jgi:hypothetical protein